MNKHFPLLSFIASVLCWVGALVVAAGLVLLFIGATQVFGGARDSGSPVGLFTLVGGIVAVPLGLGSIAFGEVIGVLFAIEANTRKAVSPSITQSGTPGQWRCTMCGKDNPFSRDDCASCHETRV